MRCEDGSQQWSKVPFRSSGDWRSNGRSCRERGCGNALETAKSQSTEDRSQSQRRHRGWEKHRNNAERMLQGAAGLPSLHLPRGKNGTQLVTTGSWPSSGQMWSAESIQSAFIPELKSRKGRIDEKNGRRQRDLLGLYGQQPAWNESEQTCFRVSRLSGDAKSFIGTQSKGVPSRLFPQPLSKMPLRFHSSDIRSVSCLTQAARHAASGFTGQKGSASFSRVSNTTFVTTEVARDPVFLKPRHLRNFLTPLNLSEWAE